jgi:hypothetical protein
MSTVLRATAKNFAMTGLEKRLVKIKKLNEPGKIFN